MSDGAVPRDRPVAATTDLVIGRPVRAQSWHDFARLLHWVSGRGQCIVPTHRVAMIVDNTTETMRFYSPGSGRGMYRLWVFDLRSTTDGVQAVGTMSINGGSSFDWYTLYADGRTLAVLEPGGPFTPSTAEAEHTVAITSSTATGGVAVRIESVGCWELPRAALDRTAADCGVSLDSLFPRRPLFHDGDTPPEASVSAVIAGIHAITVGVPLRRIGHVSRWGYQMEIASAGPVGLTVMPYRVVPRKVAPADTTKSMRARVYGYEATSVGEFRVTTTSGGASAWTTLPTAAAWSSAIDFDVECESTTTADGTPAGGYDTVLLQVRTDGAATARVRGWSVYEVT